MQFQAVCSKWNKKLTISISAPDINSARNILHSQGYSIIEIHEFIDTDVLKEWNFFYFDAVINWVLQSWKIQSDDIFKAYRKLVEDLWYNVRYIYTAPWVSEEQKRLLTAKVKDGYNMYLQSIGEKEKEEDKLMNVEERELQDFSPQLLKEIEKYNKTIDETIEKIQNLIIKHHEVISVEQKSLLERLEMELAQLKGTRNIAKIQSTLENSLKQVWSVELELLKKWMIQEKQKFLSDTNSLLKEIWSWTRIQTEQEKKESIEYKLGSVFQKISSSFSLWRKAQKSANEKIDTHSFIYFKNKRELDIYKKSLKKNNKALIKAFFTFQREKVKRLLLKRKLLVQNIQIIDNRIKNTNISYTKIVHWLDYYAELFFGMIRSLSNVLVLSLFFYMVAYILLRTLDTFGILSAQLKGKTIFFITLFSLFTTFLLFIRWWKMLVMNVFLFLVFFTFLSLNF